MNRKIHECSLLAPQICPASPISMVKVGISTGFSCGSNIAPILLALCRLYLQQCFCLLDLPPLGDRRPSALFAEMQSLLPRDANILFNALFVRRLPDFMRIALTDRGELLPGDLAAAADLLQHFAPAPAAMVAAVSSPPQLLPPAVHAIQPPFRRRQS